VQSIYDFGGPGLGKQVQQKAAQHREINLVAEEKALNAPTIGLLLDASLQQQRNLSQIRRPGSQHRRRKPDQELQSGEMPAEITRENVSERAYVPHSMGSGVGRDRD